MKPTEQKKAAKKFVERWNAAEGNEQRESNKFWIELCGEVLGISNPTHVLDFERKVKGKRIDVFYEDMAVRIENKSYGICRVTGKLIPKERLRLVPHATLTVEAKEMLAKQGKN